MSNRNLKPWESGAIPVSTPQSGADRGAPAPVDFEDVEMDFDEDSIEYATATPPPPPLDDDGDGFEGDDDFEGVHTNVTNVNELKEWLVGADGVPRPPSVDHFDPEATSLVSGVDMGELLNAAQRSQSGEQPPRPPSTDGLPPPQATGNFTVSGSLEAFQLGELLQLFATSRRTGALTLVHDGHEGKLYMNMGDVYAATWDGQSPEDPSTVMRQMAKLKTGEFRFGPLTKDPPPVNVNMSMPQLLILLLGDMDDDGPQEIALDAPLQLAEPITQPLRALSPDELDVLQLVHNQKTLEAMMPMTELGAEQLQEMVSSLIERGYIKKLEFLDSGDEFFGGGLF